MMENMTVVAAVMRWCWWCHRERRRCPVDDALGGGVSI